MSSSANYRQLFRTSIFVLLCSFAAHSSAQDGASASLESLIVGNWVINDALSDNSDDAVEAAIKAGGGKVPRRWFSRRAEDFYRGGPVEQELYDRLSYDDVLTIAYSESEFRFEYADDFIRVFHTDGRRQTSAANDFYASGGADFSFGNWDGNSLLVEARPRDDGFTLETYTLQADGSQLVVKMQIQPGSFAEPVTLTRIYDRAN